jgi:spore maturation protein CgeB
MRLIRVTRAYPEYLHYLEKRSPLAPEASYSELKSVIDQDLSAWSSSWTDSLLPHGFEAETLVFNWLRLQNAWTAENGACSDAKHEEPQNILISQLRAKKPEILWFDDSDERLLSSILDAVPSIRAVLGWVGSALPETQAWRLMNCVLTCASESAEELNGRGIRSRQIHHAFDPRILTYMPKIRAPSAEVVFVGQIIRSSRFHLEREQLLLKISKAMPLKIHSSSTHISWKEQGITPLKISLFAATSALGAMGVPTGVLQRIPLLEKAARWKERPRFPVNHQLRKHLCPPLYGLDMHRALHEARVTLNIHADSSPRFASNMRLFETTGAGSCLLTDARSNLAELFEPEREIVTYSSAEECLEKAQWLLRRPQEAERIALAGQKRTLHEHTFERRGAELAALIQAEVKRARPL